MKKHFLGLFILSFHLLSAQNERYNYSGSIHLADDSKIPYQLMFSVQSNKLIGYSISDPFGIAETKSTIVGSVNDGLFLINEIDVMSSKSEVLDNEFCLLHMNLKSIEENNIKYLRGSFKGYYADSVSCVDGFVVLIDSLSFVNSIIAKEPIRKAIEKSESSVRTLSTESSLSFQTSKNIVTLLLWDSGIVDGDVVSIFNNDQEVLLDYKVKRRKMKLELALDEGLNTISVRALSVGLYTPNTTRIQIVGIGKKYDAVTYLKLGEQAVIKIKRVTN